MQARARTGHPAAELPPLRVEVGDEVIVGEQSTEWPAFVFVTAAKGAGWVPLRYLSDPRGRARVVAAYDTTELPLVRGQVVEVLLEDDLSGWWWCRSENGTEGWVPVSALTK